MEFDKNTGAKTASAGLLLLKWAAWIIAGLAGTLCLYLFVEYGNEDWAIAPTLVIGGIAFVFYIIGKGIENYHNSILVNNQSKDAKELISIIGEENFAEVEELEVRVQKLNSDSQQAIQDYVDEGGIDDETAEAIIEAKTRTKDDIDNLELHGKMKGLNRKINILNLYLDCHIDALGKAADLHREGKTPATVRRFYQNELSNNIQGTFMESFTAALIAKNLDKAIVHFLRKNPNLQTFDTKAIQKGISKQAGAIAQDDNLTIAKLMRLL